MTDVGSGLPLAGWYPDPTGGEPGQQRWWDGANWTATIEIPPAPTIAATSDYTWDAEVSRYGEPETVNQRPLIDMTVVRDIPARWGTFSVWLLVLSPLLLPFGIAAALLAAGLSGSSLVALAAAGVIPLIAIAWAYRDRLRLISWGYHHSAHWAWVLLTPLAYLIVRFVRTRREAGIGAAPLIVHLVCILLLGAAIAAGVIVTPTIVTPIVMESVEATIAKKVLVDTRIAVEVDCPENVNILDRETPFTCTVTDSESGATAPTTVYFIYAAGSAGDDISFSTPVFPAE
jgi:hypothetical protein